MDQKQEVRDAKHKKESMFEDDGSHVASNVNGL